MRFTVAGTVDSTQLQVCALNTPSMAHPLSAPSQFLLATLTWDLFLQATQDDAGEEHTCEVPHCAVRCRSSECGR